MDNHLADKRHIILILRLAIDEDEQLMYGEIVELGGTIIGRFMEWPKLPEVLQTWLTNQDNDPSNDKPENHETHKTQ